MKTTVKIDEYSKQKLEKLRSKLLLERDIKLSLEELQTLMIDFVSINEESFVEFIKGGKNRNYDTFLSLISNWGIDTSKEDIDEVVYNEGYGNP
ncbi:MULTISPECIES: hypothetical protein [Acidianus]|uniref:Uncharacterized protein n=1 Tax=Candidatus Acidianus copahuensis TaxID=1160895 RepID=A0A031LVS5_9CREN|nr:MULTISPECIES: hypothetical protein [Acidianus]EZQ11238.1 hypothetical protein CM19_01785 [Candidatus Acidianus copahuensis]NON63166.1 hypothetical protein [Acidianus sp. RZ1]